MIEDLNKNIDIEYNHLNLPEKVYFPDRYNCSRLSFDYDAAGNKVRMLVEQKCGSQSNPDCTVEEEIHYVGNFVNVDNSLAYILNGHGRIVKLSGEFIYEYSITDHLGNVRVVFNEEGTSGANPKQYADYYPFGMRFTGTYLNNDNRYLYNSKEWEDDFALNWYNYGARMYDPQLGRWHVIDPLAEKHFNVTSYNYCLNNPISLIDPFGMDTIIAKQPEAQQMITNTLTEEDAENVQFDEDGNIDMDLLNSHCSESENYNSLQDIVNSDLVLNVTLNDCYKYADENGNKDTYPMGYQGPNTFEPDLTGTTTTGLSTGESGLMGKTLFPDRDGKQNSQDKNINVVINMKLSKAGRAESFSHEKAHAVLYIYTNKDHKAASHQNKTWAEKDPNTRLTNLILLYKQETIKNMRSR